MYEQHFGLQKRPFNAKATGNEVFVGPQTAKTMAGFRKALAAQDSVVTVSGAPGTGKTTLVDRSLDAIGTKYKTIRVGRMQMDASDVLESLLIVLGIQDRPNGTIQRFTALRKKLKDLQDAETRVFVLVEDALRTGTDTLAELEALTAADAGESDGASIVLMGDERLFDFMKEPQLAQLQQRIRQRHRLKPLCVAELRGYLRHCLRLAGADYDELFDARSAELLHGLCDGIPRVANNIVDAAMMSAAAQGSTQLSASFIANVAEDEFGLTVENFDFSEPAPEAAAAAAETAAPVEPAAALEKAPETSADAGDAFAPEVPTESEGARTEPEPATAIEAETVPEPCPAEVADPVAAQQPTEASDAAEGPVDQPVATQDPVIVFADDKDESAADSKDIPHLIQDTLPDLAVLSARYAALEQSYVDNPPDSAVASSADHAVADIPELQAEPQVEIQPDRSPEPTVEDESTNDAPEAATTDKPESTLRWEMNQEPEFELVTEVVPSLKIEVPDESAAGTATTQKDIPELKAEPVPGPAADNIPELLIEPEPAVDDIPELATEARQAADDIPELLVDPEPAADDIPELLVDAEPAGDDVPKPAIEPEPAANDIPEIAIEPDSAADDIPELAIEPEPAVAPTPVLHVSDEQPDAAAVPETVEVEPEVPAQTDDKAGQAAKEDAVADWDRDPTLAQLKPDLDALEQALAFTHGAAAASAATAAPEPEELAKSVLEPEELPEITLDKSIETGIGDLGIEEPADIQPPKPAKKPNPELDRIAADIANAKSIEDIDDIMAETLFGTGISMIAAQVTANPPRDDSANDELELVQEAPDTPPPPAVEETPPAVAGSAAPDSDEPGEEISIETRSPVANTGLDLSASQRLKTVRALNADLHPSLREPENAKSSKPSSKTASADAPQPIEDQINTSITQTLKALKVPPQVLDDEPEEQPKKGFLSRFRRS